nr:hypothetical protein [Natrinema sp. SYSU A 869]
MSRSDAEQENETDAERVLSFDGVRSSCSLEDFTDLYWDEIAPCLEAGSIDPTSEKPPH